MSCFAVLLLTISGSPGLLAPVAEKPAPPDSTASLHGRILDRDQQRPLSSGILRIVDMPFSSAVDDSGWYSLRGIPAGVELRLLCDLPFCTPLTVSVTPLQAGEVRRVDLTVPCRSWKLDEVVVRPKGWLLGKDHTGGSAVITDDRIARLPSLGGELGDLTSLAPLVNGGSALGRNERYNSIQVDGMGFNDLFGLGRTGLPGGQANSTPLSLESVDELEVQVAPFDIRNSGFTGALVNVSTPRARESISGKVYLYGRNQSFAGPGREGSGGRLEDFGDIRGGGRIGGKIVPALSFFLSGEIARRRAPIDRRFGASASGATEYTLPADSVGRFTRILRETYGYDAGSISAFTMRRESEKLFATLQWDLGSRLTLSAGYHFFRAFEENPPAYGGIYGANSRFETRSRMDALHLSARWIVSPKLVNVIRLSGMLTRDPSGPVGDPFPFLFVNTRDSNGRLFQLAGGSENFRIAVGTNQRVFEFSDEILLYSGSHVFTAGGTFITVRFENSFIPDNYGTYFFNSLDDLERGLAAAYFHAYATGSDPRATARWGTRQVSLYLQDDWAATERLSIKVGLRMDLATFPDAPLRNPRVDSLFGGSAGISTDRLPDPVPLISPRASFVLALDEERESVLRGGVGAFLGRIPLVWIGAQYLGTGVDIGRAAGFGVPFDPDPFSQPRSGSGVFPQATSEITVTGDEFRFPALIRTNLAFVRVLPFGAVGTAELVVDRIIRDVGYEDLNLVHAPTASALAPQGRLTGDGRPVYGVYAGGQWTPSTISSAFTHVMRTKNVGEGGGFGLTLQVEGPRAEALPNVSVSYTYSRSRDVSSNTLFGAVEQWERTPISGDPNDPPLALSSFSRAHRILAVITHRFASTGTTIGISYSGVSGRPFSYVYDGDVNGDGARENDLLYVPRDRNDVILMDPATGLRLPAGDAAYDDLNAAIESDGYLSSIRGRISERNGGREPWRNQWNLRLIQELPHIGGNRLELVLDLLNVLNLLNREWGSVDLVAEQRDLFLSFHSLDTSAGSPDFGRPRFIWGKRKPVPWVPDNLDSRWQAQLGVRYLF